MIIYKITNKINGKIYIGQTIQALNARMRQHLSPPKSHTISAIDAALKKYSINSFTIEIIDAAESIEELNEKEIYWISYYNSLAPNGYNLTEGGKNAKHEQSTRDKISAANAGRFSGSKSPRAKAVTQYSLDGKFIAQYGSTREAERETGIKSTAIAAVCRGKHYIANGFRWAYEGNELPQLSSKSAHLIEYNGETHSAKEWADIFDIPYTTFLARLSKGWDADTALNKPINVTRRNKRCKKC